MNMLLSSQKSIEDFVIEALATKNLTAGQLLFLHNAHQKQVTLQAIYKALHKLILEGVLLKHKDEYVLSNIWKQKIMLLLDQKQTVPTLKEMESIIYSFKSFPQLDEYWKHIQEGTKEESELTYYFCPHQYWWFVPGRRESEMNFYKAFLENKSHAVLLIGGVTQTDKETKKLIVNDFVQVHLDDNNGFRMTDSLTIKNNLIITTRLPMAISNKISGVFNQNLSSTETEVLLADIFRKKIPVRIIIERNNKKAEKLKKQIGKYFYIKNG